MTVDDARLREWSEASSSRAELWTRFVDETAAASVAEIGVYRGQLRGRLLDDCPGISTYYMLDPWRNLADWNKPANKSDKVFEEFFDESMERTAAHEDKRVVLRGTTVEVIDRIPDGSLDFAYVDGDHTLRGITVDLIRVFPKVRDGGWIGGDDFAPRSGSTARSTSRRSCSRSPSTSPRPSARHLRPAAQQFLIEKAADSGHAFVDLTGRYGDLELEAQLDRRRRLRRRAASGRGCAPAEAQRRRGACSVHRAPFHRLPHRPASVAASPPPPRRRASGSCLRAGRPPLLHGVDGQGHVRRRRRHVLRRRRRPVAQDVLGAHHRHQHDGADRLQLDRRPAGGRVPRAGGDGAARAAAEAEPLARAPHLARPRRPLAAANAPRGRRCASTAAGSTWGSG